MPESALLGEHELYLDSPVPLVPILRRHLCAEGRLTPDCAARVLRDARAVLSREPNLLSLEPPIHVVGDVHGQFYDLLNLFTVAGSQPSRFSRYLFLGDYVDRGMFGAEVVLFLCACKVSYPRNVFLLRGNHECRLMGDWMSFKHECARKYSVAVYHEFQLLFDSLPLAAVVNNTPFGGCFCAHGGISPCMSKVTDINDINRFCEVPESGLMCDLLWSDPVPDSLPTRDSEGFVANHVRKSSWMYGGAAMRRFLEANRLGFVLRGHQAQEEGFKEHFASATRPPMAMTLFSAPNYCDNYGNKGAVLLICRDSMDMKQFFQRLRNFYTGPQAQERLKRWEALRQLRVPVEVSFETAMMRDIELEARPPPKMEDIDALLDSALTRKPAPSALGEQQPQPQVSPAPADAKPAPKRSRSRSSHRHHSSRHGHHHGHGHSSSRHRHSSHRSRSRSRSRDDRRRAEDEDPREAERRQAERDSRTVFAFNLPLKAVDRDIRAWFEKAGKVADVRLITDRNSRKSKGVGYIEFETMDSVPRALALSGQQMNGQTVMVQLTQAEKNRAAATTAVAPPVTTGPTKIHIGNLPPNISEADIKAIFALFGDIESVVLPTDTDGSSKGLAVVQYRKNEEARKAIQNANGVEVAGRALKVSFALAEASATVALTGGLPSLTDLDDDDGRGGLALNAHARALLMAKLQRPDPSQPGQLSPVPQPMIPLAAMGYGAVPLPSPGARVPMSPVVVGPTTCVLLKNMFDPAEEMDPNFDAEIREDVSEECGKHGRVVHIFVDKASQGHVWVRFADVPSAARAQSALNHRWFASKMITAEYIPVDVYNNKFPGSGN
eukprot:m51a1_g3400 putative rna-binding protein 39-like (836) ;mRNA; f:542121-545641